MEKKLESDEIGLSDEELIQEAKQNFTKSINIYKAMELAVEVHKGQVYGKEPYNFPYIYHLDSVSKIILNSTPPYYPNKAELMIGAWLHDSIEDQSDKISYEIIEEKFGKNVRDLVEAVTDTKDENGKPLKRKERALNLFKRIKGNDQAILLKLSDRIANIEFCITMLALKHETLFDMYKKEFELFKEGLYDPNQDDCIQMLWAHLEKMVKDPEKFF